MAKKSRFIFIYHRVIFIASIATIITLIITLITYIYPTDKVANINYYINNYLVNNKLFTPTPSPNTNKPSAKNPYKSKDSYESLITPTPYLKKKSNEKDSYELLITPTTYLKKKSNEKFIKATYKPKDYLINLKFKEEEPLEAIYDAKIWIEEGEFFYKKAEYDKAIHCYNKALEINPLNTYVLCSKANAQVGIGDTASAINTYDYCLKNNPRYLYAWYGKGCLLYSQRNYNDAIFCFEQVLTIDPNYNDALIRKSEIQNILGLQK